MQIKKIRDFVAVLSKNTQQLDNKHDNLKKAKHDIWMCI